MTSGDYYNKALKIAPHDRKEELFRRIASVKNELGVKYMYNAQGMQRFKNFRISQILLLFHNCVFILQSNISNFAIPPMLS